MEVPFGVEGAEVADPVFVSARELVVLRVHGEGGTKGVGVVDVVDEGRVAGFGLPVSARQSTNVIATENPSETR
ncbi:hypothetical protein PMIN06_006156 [Paraphaeosphaeria minitans]